MATGKTFIKLLDRFDTRAFLAIALACSMIALTFVLAIREPNSDPFKILLGAMLTVGFASAIGWYFQSSAGSEKKDDRQAKATEVLMEKVSLTPVNGATASAITAAVVAAAPEAARAAAPEAAKAAAPPVVKKEVPPAVEEAVNKAFAKRPKIEDAVTEALAKHDAKTKKGK